MHETTHLCAFTPAPFRPAVLWQPHSVVKSEARSGRPYAGSTPIMSAARHEDVTDDNQRPATTRRAILSALMTASALCVVGGASNSAYAEEGKVWGAAELDFRMYVCGATGKFCPAMTKIKIPPARQIDSALAQEIASIPKRVLETSFSKRGTLMV